MEKGWRWRVTDEQVTAIQEMKAARTPIAKIARITGLSRPTIYRVLSHLTQGSGDTTDRGVENDPQHPIPESKPCTS